MKEDEHGNRFHDDDDAAVAIKQRPYSLDDGGGFGSSGIVQKVENDTERSDKVCVGSGKRDVVVVVATKLFTVVRP